MPGNNAAELLIRIGADPSHAEASIRRFRALFSRDLSGMGAELGKWSAQGFGDFNRVRRAVLDLGDAMTHAAQTLPPLTGRLAVIDRTSQTLAEHFKVNLDSVNALLGRNRQVAQLWRTALVANFLEVLNTSQALESSLGRGFLAFDTALGVNIANAIIWQKSIGEAFRKAALVAIGSIAQEALVRAIYSTALGFYLLAVQDYRGAALAFKSAAIYAAVGGVASVAGRALAGPEVREAERGASVRRPGSVAPELIVSGQGARPAETPQRTVQVIFQGPVYGGQAGIDELVRQISRAVMERDVSLVAYTVVRQPATRA